MWWGYFWEMCGENEKKMKKNEGIFKNWEFCITRRVNMVKKL
jgi:hypothetical protein